MGSRVLICLSLLAVAPGYAVGQLSNPLFDDNGGSLDHWSTFNNTIANVGAAPITPRSGTYVAKLFGTFDGSPNWSGMFQSLTLAPSQVREAGAYVRHNSGDNAFRSNEFVGVAPGNSWDGANPGQATAMLKPGDFIRFQTAALPGDLDDDGDVDLSDLAGLLAAYDACAGDSHYNPAADLDGDGCIDLADLAALLAYYGTGA